jgi:hypothetical protein
VNATNPSRTLKGAKAIAVEAGWVDEDGKPVAPHYLAAKLLKAGFATKVGRLIISTPEKVQTYLHGTKTA